MCKTQLTAADLMTKHQDQRKEIPQAAKHSTAVLGHGTITFLQKSLRTSAGRLLNLPQQPAGRCASSLQVTGLEGERQS